MLKYNFFCFDSTFELGRAEMRIRERERNMYCEVQKMLTRDSLWE